MSEYCTCATSFDGSCEIHDQITALKAQLAEVTAQRDIAEANLARLQERWDARPATEELEARLAEVEAELAFARSTGDEAALEYRGLRARLAEAERDAARYRWIHDNIDWIDGTGYVLNTLHPDADGCAMFQWGVDAAMADSAASQPSPAHVHTFTMGVCACGERSDAYLYY